MDATKPGATRRPAITVYFDGQCPVCSREIALYRRSSGAAAVRWVDVYSHAFGAKGDPDRETALARLHVRARDGSLLSGAAAFRALWSELPRWRWLARLSRPRLITVMLEHAYNSFLALRRRLLAGSRRHD